MTSVPRACRVDLSALKLGVVRLKLRGLMRRARMGTLLLMLLLRPSRRWRLYGSGVRDVVKGYDPGTDESSLRALVLGGAGQLGSTGS